MTRAHPTHPTTPSGRLVRDGPRGTAASAAVPARSGGRVRAGRCPGPGVGRSAAAAARRTSRPAPPMPAPPASCAGCSRSRWPRAPTLAGVPIGRHLHTAEPVGLDPAALAAHRAGQSNTGVWVQGQPGIGKSSITKRLLTGLVGFGMRRRDPRRHQRRIHPLISAPRRRGVADRPRPPHPQPARRRPAAPALAAAAGTDRAPARRDHPRPPPVPARGPVGHRAPRARSPSTERRLLAAALDLARPTADPDREPTIPDRPPRAHHRRGPARCRSSPPRADRALRTGAVPGSWSTPSGCCVTGASAGCSTGPPPSPPTRTPPPCRWTSPRSTTTTTTSSPRRCCARGPGRPPHRRTAARPAPQHRAGPGRAVAGAAGGARAGGALRPDHPPGPAPRRSSRSRSPTPSTTSTRCPPRPTGPKPAAWPPATPSWCSAAWPTKNSTGSAGSPRSPTAKRALVASWAAPPTWHHRHTSTPAAANT